MKTTGECFLTLFLSWTDILAVTFSLCGPFSSLNLFLVVDHLSALNFSLVVDHLFGLSTAVDVSLKISNKKERK